MNRIVLTLLLIVAATPPLAIGLARLAGAVLMRRYPPPGRLVAIGGFQLHMYCVGEGGPAVILESGLGVSWVDWRLVQEQTARFTRVCVYDRAGYGWSGQGTAPRTAGRIAEELRTLLDKMGERRPVVLAGHSFGALIARLYASRYPGEVAGLVLVDSSEGSDDPVVPDRWTRLRSRLPALGTQWLVRMWKGQAELPPGLRQAPGAYQRRFLIFSPPGQRVTETRELESMAESEAQARSAAPLGNLPLVVLTAGKPGMANWERQASLAALSLRGRQVAVPGSSHFIQREEPERVVAAIREVAVFSR